MADAGIYHVSEEEENYARMELLLKGISPRAVRVLFDKEFHPSCLEDTIKKAHGQLFGLKMKHVINAEQWKSLFPRGGDPNSTSFDVPLMVTLLRNLAELDPPTGGYDYLPLSTDTIPTADLARIKYYRNEMAHNKTATITSAFFTTAWENVSGAVRRLGGQTMEEECKELRTKRLDHSTVPWNIRDQICTTMDQWRKNDVNFVETSAAKLVLQCVQEESCVTITASSGVGKTATLGHVVLKMADEGYDVLLVSNPQDIVKFYNPTKKTLFVIDDFCGTYSINQSDLQNWEPVMKRIEELIQNKLTKIVVACRLQVYKEEKFESLSIFRSNVCNLLSEDLCLSHFEKKLIADIYLKSDASAIMKYSDLFDCFPLLCKLYHDNPKLNVTDFFQNPFSVYEAEIDQLKKRGCFGKYCALALCVMFNNELDEEVLTDEIDTKTRAIIENTFEACRVDKGTSRLILLDELGSLEHTFIKKEQNVYKAIHDKLFDFLSYYFGKKMIRCIIKNAHCEFINERMLLEREEDMDQFITIVPPQYHQMYMERMVYDWSNGEVENIFYNTNMKNPTFRQRYLCYLNSLDILYQRKLAHTCDNETNTTVLIVCCFIGDIPLIQWCCNHFVDVNMCGYDNVSPLCVSSHEGHINIVKMLLDTEADINKCSNNELSPLFAACQQNHVDIVKLLLDTKADINKCTIDGASPLFIACQQNHLDIVKLLLNKKVDINKCATNKELTPLFTACSKNHVDIVKLLLDNKADINMCTIEKASPLYIACQNNHVDIVKLLLDNKADINKCRNDESSPLFIASQNDHLDIVKLLLDNKADINKCTNDESSPLFIASQNDHLDIVKLLLDNKPNVNKSRVDGNFPLFVACQKNHANIVKLLIDNKANINKCRNSGVSSLLVACLNNHVDVVKLLMDNNADIHKCRKDGISPLFIASQNNHIDVVKMLLDKKADINKCRTDGLSPLFMASQRNHINVVKLLLENKADVNKSRDDETSPLYMACQEGHTDTVKLLLDNRADSNKSKNNKKSPLCVACQEGHTHIVKLLLDNKADVNKCTDDEKSPLFMACQEGHTDTLKLLLDNKADINKCTDEGISPLLIACYYNHVDVVKLLLDNNADVNKCEINGASPLLIASQENHVHVAKQLLDNKADIHKCKNDGINSLLMACNNNHEEIVKLLLENKADVNKCTNDGASPLFIACSNNNVDMIKLLLDKEADINKRTDTGASPFFIACIKGNIDIVKILLPKGADHSIYINYGDMVISPKKIASILGHSNIVSLICEHSRQNQCM